MPIIKEKSFSDKGVKENPQNRTTISKSLILYTMKLARIFASFVAVVEMQKGSNYKFE